MSFIFTSKKSLQDEMSKLLLEEGKIDFELTQYFGMLRKNRTIHGAAKKRVSLDSQDLFSNLLKIENSGPTFEAMLQDSKKLANQIEEGRELSDRLSGLVRRLDVMQIHSQQAMSCTEDIMNMKECKSKLAIAMEDGNLSCAVSLIRQVHEIDLKAAKTSEDFETILNKEQELKEMVQKEFNSAISDSNIDKVMSLCPMLKTLGLETEARDTFLDFVVRIIFVNISANVATNSEGTVDAATGYAQELSGIFNQAFIYMQNYLPMVIAGMESSHGDVHFIRRLHNRVEEQSGILLKRYMKFRHVKEMANFCKSGTAGAVCSTAVGAAEYKQNWSTADIHCTMDELGLLIQYCNRYSDFLKHVCDGAESKIRRGFQMGSDVIEQKIVVFTGPTGFDRMKGELISKYYLVGESWLIDCGVHNALQRSSIHGSNGLDECFFVLQKCALRAIATNDVNTACVVLRSIIDLVSSDLLTQGTEILLSAVGKVGVILHEHMTQYKRSMLINSSDSKSGGVTGPTSLSSGFQNAMSLATSIGGASTVARDSLGSSSSGSCCKDDIQFLENGGFWFSSSSGGDDNLWGVATIMDAFNVIELCARYTERLGKDIWTAGQLVFTDDLEPESNPDIKPVGSRKFGQQGALFVDNRSPAERLRLWKEDFEACATAFNDVYHLIFVSSFNLM
jgi:hypothetical protein